MNNSPIKDLGSMDIYLIDQLMKNRINSQSVLLDAGYGKGRNLEFFIRHKYQVFGIDHNESYRPIVIEKVEAWDANYDQDKIITGSVENMPYKNDTFDFVFSVAVLHFAQSHEHYYSMLNEMVRVCKPGGYVLFRMTSWHTFDLQSKNETGMINLADGLRYMLDIDELKLWAKENKLQFADPIKTTNVDGHRTMTTIVLQK
jgi:SAM-dependent methyltransferase